MRRKDRLIASREQIDAIIRSADVCRLAFARNDEPYLVPVSFGYDGTAIYFHTAPQGLKLDFIEANDRVCFELESGVELVTDSGDACDWSFKFESVIGRGRVVELTSTENKRHALNQIMLHYSGREWTIPEHRVASTRVWKIDIDEVSGKRSQEKAKG